MSKIIFHLKGGLGNQLFIAAAAILTSKLHPNVKVRLDESFLERDSLRDFALDAYSLPPQLGVERAWIHGILHRRPRIRRLLKGASLALKEEEINLFDLPSQASCVEGYFQNLEYVDYVKKEMLQVCETYKSSQNIPKLPESYIAVHVRRGDYLKPENQKVHGLVSTDYVIAGIQEVQGRIGELPVVLFTDSPAHVHEEFSVAPFEFQLVGPDEATAELTLAAMAKAKGLVISNSSLSWWAAWVATRSNAESITPVVRPKNWYAGRETPEELVPKDWITIAN